MGGLPWSGLGQTRGVWPLLSAPGRTHYRILDLGAGLKQRKMYNGWVFTRRSECKKG